MSEPAVRLRLDGAVLWATLDRPRARNAIDGAVLDGLEALLARAREARVKVVVLRGAGGTFCAGADLRAVRELLGDPQGLRTFLARLGAVLDQLERAPWVIVAVVEGYAVAGGCELLLACDVALASTEARIGDRHVEYGLVPGAGGSVRLPRAVAAPFARYLLLSGELISGEEAAARGLVALAAPPERLEQELERVVARLRSRGRSALATVKAMLAEERGGAEVTLAHARERDLFLAHATGAPDVRIGLDAFEAGVAPVFLDDAGGVR